MSLLALVWAGYLAVAAGCGSFASRGMNAEGVRHFQQGQYREAVQQFQGAIQNDPMNADSYYNLAATYHRVGKASNRRADLDQAENLYNQALDRDSQHRDSYRGLAVLLAEENRSEEAFRLLEGWTAREPMSAEARIELARLLEEFGDPQAARTVLAEALQLDPRNQRAHVAMGRIWEQLGEPQKALVDYQRALAVNRFQPDVTARVAALQTRVGTTVAQAPLSGEDRLVTRNLELRR
jgi:Tfp pilus assembly protein PilF